jgi:hypothetical protein
VAETDEARVCVEMYGVAVVAGSSAMPGWVISSSGQTCPALLDMSSVARGGESRVVGLVAWTFSRVRSSSALFKGGLGSALLVRSGGLTRRGVVDPAC